MIFKTQFQHTAARRRLEQLKGEARGRIIVSTHSRPKAAGGTRIGARTRRIVSTHSRPKAAGPFPKPRPQPIVVSTHSRPKAAGKIKTLRHLYASVSTHSRPKAAGATVKANCRSWVRFNTQPPEGGWIDRAQQRRNRQRVSTHSRPKAAGCHVAPRKSLIWFQHTAARRRLVLSATSAIKSSLVSTHSRPKAAGPTAQCRSAKLHVSTHSRPKAAGFSIHY